MKKSSVALLITFLLIFSSATVTLANNRCKKNISDLFLEISPSVVAITAIAINPFSIYERLQTSTGSGFIIDPSGFILTNSHVVFGRKAIMVTFINGITLPAIMVGADPLLDIAVIKVGVPGNTLSSLSLIKDETIRVGEEVLAIGYPLGLDQTLTRGIISGTNRILPISPMSLMVPMLQTDAPINPGNSGGPLINRCGEVIGMNTSVIIGAENVGFAIPSNLIKSAYKQLVTQGRIIRPWVGINGKLIKKADINAIFSIDVVDGYLLESIEPGSPAEEIGLVGGLLQIQVANEFFLFGGDIITAINGKSMKEAENFIEFAENLKVGDTILLDVYRHGKMMKFKLNAIERPILPWDLPRGEAQYQY